MTPLILTTATILVASATFDVPEPTPFGEIPVPHFEAGSPADTALIEGPPADLALPPAPRPELPDVLPFGVGEWLKFSIDYGIINAGAATMEVNGVRRIVGQDCFDIRTEAHSNAFFSKFYKVRDRAQTFVHTETLLPLRFEKHQREGGYKRDMLIKFDRRRNFAKYEDGEEIMVHPHTQDELSSFYYMRTLPLEPGTEVLIDNHTHHKNYPLKVIIHRREEIEVPAGKFDCFVIEPVVREGGIFQAKGKLTIWITADPRRMPVKMSTKIAVGSITASLKEYRLGEVWERAQAEQEERSSG